VAVIWPVHDENGPLFHVVVRSHWGDVGGMTPGSLNGAATDILQEGLRLNYLKLDKGGSSGGRSELLRLIFDNVRATAEAASDFQAVLGICRVAEGRLRDLTAKYGRSTLLAAIDDILDASERRMRAAMQGASARRVPACRSHRRKQLDAPPTRRALPAHDRAGPARGRFRGHVGPGRGAPQRGSRHRADLCHDGGEVVPRPVGPINSGTLRAITVKAPEGTIVNARPPAPCGGLNEVRFGCDAAVMGALGQAIPERMTGDVRGTSNHTYIGGRSFIFYEYPSGGTGAWADGDGNNAVRAFNEGENVSIQSTEMVERVFPCGSCARRSGRTVAGRDGGAAVAGWCARSRC
jgi:N-methylhydantoinase B